MACIRIFLLLVVVVIEQSFAQDMRSLEMSIMTGSQFQCASTTCLPFTTVTAKSILACQMECLAQVHCQAASFQQSNSNCELFADISNQIGNMVAQVGTVTMVVIAETRIPPEPTTTTTTSTTTTATTTSVTPYPPCGRSYCCTYLYPTPCTYNGHTCRCDDGGGGPGTFFCAGCAGPGPSDYGDGSCYYGGYYYSGC